MKVIENLKLNNLELVKQNVDSLEDLPYIPNPPLEATNMCNFFVGAAGAGKTSLILSLLVSHPTKKRPEKSRAYYKFFSKIYLISASLQSLPLDKLNLNEDRIHNKYSDKLLEDIIKIEQEDDENNNVLIILDDVIKSLKNNKESEYLTRCILNRRHILNDPKKKGCGSLSIWILSQRYIELPLTFRVNSSSIFLLRTVGQNNKEKEAVKNELMCDLTPKQQDEVMKIAWKDKYSFLLILNKKTTKDRYYKKFDKILITDESDSEESD